MPQADAGNPPRGAALAQRSAAEVNVPPRAKDIDTVAAEAKPSSSRPPLAPAPAPGLAPDAKKSSEPSLQRGRSLSPDPRMPAGSTSSSVAHVDPAPAPDHDHVTPQRAPLTRQSFNDAARPNASMGRVKSVPVRNLQAPPAAEFKVVLVGSTNAGKTCLAYRYVCGGFRNASAPTVGAAFNCVYEKVAKPKTQQRTSARRLSVRGGSATSAASQAQPTEDTVKIGLWDTAGQEQFAELVPLYFRDAHAVIFVVDSTRRDALDDLNRWFARVATSAPPHVMRYLAVTKSDLPEDDRWITLDDALEFVAQEGFGGAAAGVGDALLSPGRSSVATSAFMDDGLHALNGSMYGGRAASVATTAATRRGKGTGSIVKVFEVSSVTGEGISALFSTVAADSYRRHVADQEAKKPAGATRHAPSQPTVRPGATAGAGRNGKRDKKCC